ncbi:tetratricopeptide repeat protein [Coleofasciculus sp. FACHB-SPT36]|uniref:tetratricopeptide repeat protein n=1 Tax=Cyanophyceae TaxID=3028117 RepID=UPI00168BC9AF|nr:tetratricopeptide repeat protein [Coleofasciculus sp. FACHB-SPT36]MBD2540731.1 tetratricopeptide repeat protein [Coleofasciculus sp. FACHB-SPT36]
MSDILPSGKSVLAELGINSEAIKLIQPHWKRTHYRAVVNWLTKYNPKVGATNLEKVRGYLEAFHHLCEVEEWEKASKIIFIHINTVTKNELHKQLNLWGYSYEQAELYERLLSKLTPELDAILWNGLGNSYQSRADYNKAIECFQNRLKIALEIKDRKGEGHALGGIGATYRSLGDYPEALKYFLKTLSIVREVSDYQGEGITLRNLGKVYAVLGDYHKAINFYNSSLVIARKIKDYQGEIVNLRDLGEIYMALGNYPKAFDYYH